MPEIGGSIERVTDHDRLMGVRGWLLLPPVVVLLTFLGIFIEFLQLANSGQASGAGQWIFTIVMIAPLVLLGTLAIIRLLQERKSGRRLMIIFFGIMLFFQTLIAVISYQAVDTFSVFWAFRGIAMSAAIIVYLLVSRRVKLTLVN